MTIFKEQNFKSLFFYYFRKFFIIFLLIVFITVSCICYFFTKNLYSEMKNNDIRLQSQFFQVLQDVSSECEKTYDAIVSNNNLTQFLYTNFENQTKKTVFDSYNTVNNLLVSNTLTSTYIKDIIILSKKNKIIVSASGSVSAPYSNFSKYAWYGEFLKSNSAVLATTITENGNMILCRSITPSYDVGEIFFVIDVDEIKNNVYGFLPKNSRFYFFNEKILIFSDNKEKITDMAHLNKIYSREKNVSGYNIYTKKIEPYSYKSVLMLENKKYVNLFTESVIIFIIVLLLSVILVYWISYTLAKNTMEPISNIIKILEDPKNANSALKLHNSPEMQFITKNILKSIDDNLQYREQLEKNLSELNDALETTLWEQIQPHFLFNTLETIQAVTFELTKNKNTAYKMIEALANLLKISFRNDSKFITVNEEINHIKNYLNIQNIRYSDRFEAKWDIDENCLEFSTLKLILQPIVENAIYHGVKNSNHFCYIKISVKESKNKECIDFFVENNGKAIEKEKLESIQKILREEIVPSNSHIGLNNVNKRIKIAFGKKYGCDIKSTEEKTVVTITIPKIKL